MIRNFSIDTYIFTVFISCMTLLPAVAAGADEGAARWKLQLSPYTLHFNSSNQHKYVWMAGVERESASHWLIGGNYFQNSFGQPCWFWYGGYRWDGSRFITGSYAKLAGGVIVGYDKPYEDKIPLNWDGVGIGALPAIGWQYQRFELQLNLLGTAGLMMSLNIDLFP
jgi:hypothetical protein